MESFDIEAKILKILSQHQEGLDDRLLSVNLKNVDEEMKVHVINRLIENNRVVLAMNDKGMPIYKFQSEEQAGKMKDMEQEDIPVFQMIEDSRDRGIQTIEIKTKLQPLGYNTAIVNKILKKLEKRGIIKKLKSIQQKNRQVWMLMEIEPSNEVTGGLIGDESFNIEVIEVVQGRILEYLKNHGQTSYLELSLYVKQMGVLSNGQDYRDDYIRQIIQALVYDQKVIQIQGGEKDTNATFKISNLQYPYQVQYSQTPCAHCPVRQECGPNNLINPKACPYLTDWLNQM